MYKKTLHGRQLECKTILDRRAAQLAKPVLSHSPEESQAYELVSFRLGDERYGIEARYVRRVLPFRTFTHLPDAPPLVVGIMNLEGHILAVFDLRLILGRITKDLSDLSRLIVLGQHHDEFGILADQTDELRRVPCRDILALSQHSGRSGVPHVLGTTKEALIVLDARRLLEDPALMIHQHDYPHQEKAAP